MNKINPNINPSLVRVSGPVNVLRLEGDVHGIKKVIYIFMDYHINVKNQTQCANIFSKDVQKYFADNFFKLNENDKIYDFFLEIYPTELSNRKQLVQQVDFKDKYIEEVVKFFRKIFVYDPRQDKVQISNLFKNLRLHYIDIRDYYKINIYDEVSQMKNIASGFMSQDSIDIKSLENIIELLNVMKSHLQLIVRVLSNENAPSSKPKLIKSVPGEIDVEVLEYLAKKIKGKYKYDDIRVQINKLIEQNLKNFQKTINDIDNAIKQFNQYADEIADSGNRLIMDPNTNYLFSYGLSVYTIRKIIIDIANRIDTLIDDQFVEYFARFIDIYFLRRFLDKDYITNAIIYTGALHSNTYIYQLVKVFNFRVTHASYSKIPDMNKLTDEIRKRTVMEVQELILPEIIQQCSDLTGFPNNFD